MEKAFTINYLDSNGNVQTETGAYKYSAIARAEELVFSHGAKHAEAVHEPTGDILAEFNAISPAEMRDICIAAINAALVSHGKRKGMLKARCPGSRSDGAAAWQAMMIRANPYKVSVAGMMFFSPRQRAVYNAIDKALDGADVRGHDRDRVALELMGAW